MNPDEDGPKLHIDSDWKSEAQAEKERLAKKAEEKAKAREAAAGGQKLPEASFTTLMSMLASQAIMGLGAMQDKETGGMIIDLEGARFAIDLLAVIEEKTKGNLSEDETRELAQVLNELRGRFVQVSDLVAQQAAAGGVTEMPASGAAPGATPGATPGAAPGGESPFQT